MTINFERQTIEFLAWQVAVELNEKLNKRIVKSLLENTGVVHGNHSKPTDLNWNCREYKEFIKLVEYKKREAFLTYKEKYDSILVNQETLNNLDEHAGFTKNIISKSLDLTIYTNYYIDTNNVFVF